MYPVFLRPGLVASLLLAASAAHAQGGSLAPADTTRPRLPGRHQIGVLVGFGISTVNPEDDYYLPNDGIKVGSEVAFTYTYAFVRQPYASVGIRTGVGLMSRAGHYTFFGQEMRRAETFLTVPLELVTRYRWPNNPRTYSTAAVGAYFSELASRYTYTLNPGTGKTDRSTAEWVYATGGVATSFGIGFLRPRRSFRELGIRLSADLFRPKAPDAGQFPNLRQGNISLYYATSFGF